MPYEPKVNDYVVWTTAMGLVHEGWVYFKCDQYITIEIGVKPKPNCEYAKNDRHCMIHCLLLCYTATYHELEYITKRDNPHHDVTVPKVSTKRAK